MNTSEKSISTLFSLFLSLVITFGLSHLAHAKPGGGGKKGGGNSDPITILQHPASAIVHFGDSTTLSVVASVNKGPSLKYQWFFNGTAIQSATSSTLTLHNLSLADMGEYFVSLTSGDRAANSQSASISQDPSDSIDTSSNSAPIANNDTISTKEDTAVLVDVLFNDTDADNHTLSVTSASALNGATTINSDGTLQYSPYADFNGNDTINYTITDSEGASASAYVDVTVIAVEDLRISYQPSSANIYQGDSYTLNISAIGEGELSYQWLKDGVEITGANQSYLTIENAESNNEGSYEVIVTDANSSLVSNSASIVVSELSGIQLSWNIPELRNDGSVLSQEDISAFVIYCHQASTDTAQIIETSGTTTSYSIEGLRADNYTLWISTVDINGSESELSDYIQVTL